MRILALEFSSPRRSVAVFEISNGIAEMLHSAEETLAPGSRPPSPFSLFKLLPELEPKEIQGVAVGLGPGSYTGIRSALAIAQGWNLAHGILAAGISSMDAIALSAATDHNLSGQYEIIVDAQRGEVYSAEFLLREDECTQTGSLKILKQPRTKKIAGPDALKFSPEGLEVFPGAWAIGKLSAHSKFGPPELLEPIYLREPSFTKAPAVRHA